MGGPWAAALMCTWLAAGCGGSFEIKVSRPPDQRPDLGDDIAARGPIKLPSGTPFNLVSPSSRENGTCDARCTASPTGAASARVAAENGGSGWAEFQVGYTFDHTGKQPLGAVIELTVELQQLIETSGNDPASTSRVNVVFLIKDTNGRTLHNETLLANSSERGARRWSARQSTALDATFDPEFGYYVVVAARVEATSAAGQKAAAQLEMKQCEMTITWKNAATAMR
jgi:hypothetical protein